MFKVAALSFLFLISTAAAFEDISITAWLNKNNFTVLSNLLQATGLATALDGTGMLTLLYLFSFKLFMPSRSFHLANCNNPLNCTDPKKRLCKQCRFR